MLLEGRVDVWDAWRVAKNLLGEALKAGDDEIETEKLEVIRELIKTEVTGIWFDRLKGAPSGVEEDISLRKSKSRRSPATYLAISVNPEASYFLESGDMWDSAVSRMKKVLLELGEAHRELTENGTLISYKEVVERNR